MFENFSFFKHLPVWIPKEAVIRKRDTQEGWLFLNNFYLDVKS